MLPFCTTPTLTLYCMEKVVSLAAFHYHYCVVMEFSLVHIIN
jgi:hypothetical protein